MSGAHEIPLSRGLVAIVDEADFDWLNQWKWSALKIGASEAGTKFYAVRSPNNKMVLMHRLITGATKGLVVDHRDGIGTNNQRDNLRVCTQGQNTLNRRGNLTGRKTSRFKGVCWNVARARWAASFRHKHLGLFIDEAAAARAYDAAANHFSPAFALTNLNDGGALVRGN